MLFDLICKDGSVYQWGTNSCSIRRPDGTLVFERPEGKLYPTVLHANDSGALGLNSEMEIVLGEKCNFSCKYCYETKFRDKGIGWHTGPEDIEPFLATLAAHPDFTPTRITVWGGEPFVYWKTMKPLIEGLRKLYPLVEITSSTNGSLVTKEIIDWAAKHLVRIQLSHDGPGNLRDRDVIADDPELWHYAEDKLGCNFTINPVASEGCYNSERTRQWFRDNGFKTRVTGRAVVRIVPEHEETALSKEALAEIEASAYDDFIHHRNNPRRIFNMMQNRYSPWASPGLCNMAEGARFAVNLKGDVFPCHSYFTSDYRLGTLEELLTEGTLHVPNVYAPYEREHCRKCPVIGLCRGECPMLPPDARPFCDGIKARCIGRLKAIFKLMFDADVVEIKPHV